LPTITSTCRAAARSAGSTTQRTSGRRPAGQADGQPGYHVNGGAEHTADHGGKAHPDLDGRLGQRHLALALLLVNDVLPNAVDGRAQLLARAMVLTCSMAARNCWPAQSASFLMSAR